MKKLKNNKAADSFGLTSVRITTHPAIVVIINNIFQTKRIPDILKEGLLTPVFKKGDKTNPSNYRGISVTPILLKIMEHILNSRQKPVLELTQSKLQKGFTEKTSSVNAAMILSECINESKQEKSCSRCSKSF